MIAKSKTKKIYQNEDISMDNKMFTNKFQNDAQNLNTSS